MPQFTDRRRTYYDHEIPYRQILATGRTGWDAHVPTASSDSYAAFDEFLNSPFAPPLGAGQTALDLGCGGGQVAVRLARRGCTVHGIDFSPSAIKLAQSNARKAGLTIHFQEGDCLNLRNYADGQMDLVADNHVWHCIVGQPDRSAFLQSCFRVLRPGGILFSETMTREGDFNPATVQATPQTFISLTQNRYWPARDEALIDLKSAGFEILHTHPKSQPDAPGIGDLLAVYARRI